MKKITWLAATIGALVTIPTTVMAEDTFMEALSGGKVSFTERVRYENVDADNGKRDANAITARTTLGYETGSFHGFGAFAEFEDVSRLGDDTYNSKTNNETKYQVVADPSGTEVNQAYLSYTNFDTDFRLGRQEITYRKAPFHRFIGNVLWRQNHQSFDAFSFANETFQNTKISYAYIDQVNTIFGEDFDNKPVIRNGQVEMSTHLINLQYTGLSIGKLEGYSYLLDYDDKGSLATQTFGGRFSGGQDLNETFKLIYTAEYADQSDYKDGDMDSQNYYLAELGGKFKGWLAKFSYEMQEGDGTYSFKTPLGTNHAFQGWADMFLSTPKEGLEDMYVTVVGKVFGAKLVMAYHNFETDKSSLDAGSEFDILLQKTFMKHYTLGVKYADYNSDSEYSKVNSKSVDTEKFWLYGQLKF